MNGQTTDRGARRAIGGFTLVELLVVIGIIALLIGLLMPALSGAKQQSERVKCMSNMQTIGTYMVIYEASNNGLLIPLGPLQNGIENAVEPTPSDSGLVSPVPGYTPTIYNYQTLGTNVYPWMRWPMAIMPGNYPPIPTTNLSYYLPNEPGGDPNGIIAGPWTNKVMICPTDPQPGAAHSYLFNQHMVENQAKVLTYSRASTVNEPDSNIVVLGEKRSVKDDYYMESGEFNMDPSNLAETHVELYRHGVKLGSNYLYKDMHVQNEPPTALSTQVDPWDIVPSNSSSTN